MGKSEKVSSLRGAFVVTEDRGNILGNITNIYVNPDTKKVSAIVFKEDRMFSPYKFISADFLTKVGTDTVFVKSGDNAKQITDTVKPVGKDVKAFLGNWITTDHGRHLGNFLDFEFDSSSRGITNIDFTTGAVLPVNLNELKIGDDELIVPAAIESKMRKPSLTISLLNRLFGPEAAGLVSGPQQQRSSLSKLPKREAAAIQAMNR